MALSVVIAFAWVGFVAMIPLCIHSFKECAEQNESQVNNQNTLVTVGENRPMRKMETPPALIWLNVVVCISLIIFQIILSIQDFSLGMGLLSIFIAVVMLVYKLMLGLLFGTLVATLTLELKTIELVDGKDGLRRPADLLTKYQKLKNGCKLGLFTVSCACTFIVMTSAYSLVITSTYDDCQRFGKGPLIVIMLMLQTTEYTLYFYFFTISADKCHVSLKGMEEKIR